MYRVVLGEETMVSQSLKETEERERDEGERGREREEKEKRGNEQNEEGEEEKEESEKRGNVFSPGCPPTSVAPMLAYVHFYPKAGKSVVVPIEGSRVLAQEGDLWVNALGGRGRHGGKLKKKKKNEMCVVL